MKNKLYKYLIISLTAAFGLTTFTGCTKEYYTTEEIHQTGSEATNYSFTVGDKNPWVWNESNGRYECFFDFEELNNNMYNFGSIVAGVFVNPAASDEWLEMLPYQAVYYDTKTGEPLIVNISLHFHPVKWDSFFNPQIG